MRKSENTTNDVMIAVALQDHISRKFIDPFNNVISRNLVNSLKYKKPVGKAIVDTGRKLRQPVIKRPEKRERVIATDQQASQKTLAEKMGLFPSSPQLQKLTTEQWRHCKFRAIDRGDFCHPCPICQEPFKTFPTVLLSCTHVFHKQCLEAVHKFTGRHICPNCRFENYEIFLCLEGEKAFRNYCATKVQACWRGWLARQRYPGLLAAAPAPQDPRQRLRWVGSRLAQCSGPLLASLAQHEVAVAVLLQDTDEAVLQAQLQMSQCLPLQSVSVAGRWQQALEEARARDEACCCVCLQPWASRRPRLLLSCAHVFHRACLLACEAVGTNRCPLCRAQYEHHVLAPLLFQLDP